MALQDILRVTFADLSLLETALVHSSYVNENPALVSGHNERLEFLGDAVLGFVVAEKLYQDFPSLSEGEMTKLRAALVSRETLARVGRGIRLGDFLMMGKGEEAGGGRDKKSNLAGAMEAVIAAVFLDGGTDAARDVILRLLEEEIAAAGSRGVSADYKSRLQEYLQSRQQPAPSYRVVDEVGPEHEKLFTVEVMVGRAVLGRGTGKSKKLAETAAARLALQQLSNSFTG
jgi:ribonuclease-3